MSRLTTACRHGMPLKRQIICIREREPATRRAKSINSRFGNGYAACKRTNCRVFYRVVNSHICSKPCWYTVSGKQAKADSIVLYCSAVAFSSHIGGSAIFLHVEQHIENLSTAGAPAVKVHTKYNCVRKWSIGERGTEDASRLCGGIS